MAGDTTNTPVPADWDANEFAQKLGGSFTEDRPTAPGSVESGLATARAIMVGEPPTIALPSDGMVTLSRGLLFEEEWQRDALMRECTGADEEALSRFDLTKQGSVFLYWDMLLARTVISIGKLNFEDMALGARQDKLRQLLIGDRDSLYLALVRATWGPIRTIEGVVCPMCNESSDQNVVLEDTAQHKCDFPSKTLEDPTQMDYEVKLRRGDVVTLRLPTGEDLMQLQLGWKTEPSAAERNTVMLGRLLSHHDGSPILDPAKFAKTLGTPDRQTLINYVMDQQPGPRLGGVTTSCAHCEQEFWLELGLARLLQLGV